ncbi:MAG: ethanolamine ammonia-lyase reactivating factor EutA [Bilophila wadsworthia]
MAGLARRADARRSETAIGDAMRRMDLGDADRFVVGFPLGCLLPTPPCVCWSKRSPVFEPPSEGQPALVALAEDMGKVLGMLRPRLNGRPLVVLDELKLADGDYLDMGKPLYQGGVVPITIKSLAFSG